jgi:hypothetical protein
MDINKASIPATGDSKQALSPHPTHAKTVASPRRTDNLTPV